MRFQIGNEVSRQSQQAGSELAESDLEVLMRKTLWIQVNAGKQNATCVVDAGSPTADRVANAIQELTRRVATHVKFANMFRLKQSGF